MIEINKIYNNLPVLSSILNNSEKYWAHIHTNDGKAPELLTDHINLVRDYSLELVIAHNLNEILDNLIWEIVNQNSFIKSKEEVGNFIKSLFVNSIYFHDFGKINENFQFKRMKNTSSFNFSKKNIFYSHHSKLSAYLYITHFFLKILETSYNEQEKVYLFSIVLFFSYPILKHHSSNLHKPKVTIIESEFGEIYAQAEKYIEACNFISNETIVNILKNTERVFDAYFDLSSQSEFSLFALLKLNFSIMTTSDYLATSHYMMNWEKPLTNFGVLNPKLKEDITNNIKTKLEYNRNFYKNYNYYKNYDFSNLQEKSPDNLNILRSKMAVEVIDNIRVNSGKNLFYIEAPTGGGKTNLSMIALTELMSIDIENKTNYVSKVFYIFPFTTLITQTYQSVKDTLGLDDTQVIELHSKVGFHKSKEEDKDGLFGNEKMNYIDHLFVNFPFILCSHIKFFDIMKKNEKEINYLLHRIANSVVIIDELQSYPPSEWDKIIYFIDQYSKNFNIKFILMSATLPKIDNFRSHVDVSFINLIKNAKKNYFQNPNFKDRTNIDFSLLDIEDLTLESLCRIVYDKSIEYSMNNQTHPNSVFSIVEFIYKKTASQFYSLIKELDLFNEFDDIFVLSGTILEPRRREIINFLKNNENRDKKILLITTQVVEAGVDIDMDIGFKDQSLIDSDEQLAGRINRNVKKKNSILYLFNLDKSYTIYGNDYRYKMTRDLSSDDYVNILYNKDFDLLYNLVIREIDDWNSKTGAIGFEEYRHSIINLNFYDINKNFKLIDQDTMSVFVPCKIDIINNSNDDVIFTRSELDYLIEKKIIYSDDKSVDGERVWEHYCNLITNKTFDFIQQKINFTILQGIMAKFTFSVFYNVNNHLLKYGSQQYGFLYLANYKEIYDYYFGIDDNKFEQPIFI